MVPQRAVGDAPTAPALSLAYAHDGKIASLEFKYVCIQGRELAADTMYAAGIFSMCWKLIQEDVMSEEDVGLFKEIGSWFAEELPFPEPCMRKEPVICFFKTENSDLMMRMITPAMWLLERYNHPFYVVYTNSPGELASSIPSVASPCASCSSIRCRAFKTAPSGSMVRASDEARARRAISRRSTPNRASSASVSASSFPNSKNYSKPRYEPVGYENELASVEDTQTRPLSTTVVPRFPKSTSQRPCVHQLMVSGTSSSGLKTGTSGHERSMSMSMMPRAIS